MSFSIDSVNITVGQNKYTLLNKKLGSGVDGEVTSVLFGDREIVMKKMPTDALQDHTFETFKEINMIAMQKGFGPKIYDIFHHEGHVYILMEKLDKNLLEVMKTREVSKEEIISIVKPIHQLMFENNVSLGDDNMENYMCNSNGRWYRIDFTTCHLVKANRKKYFAFSYLNLNTNQMVKIRFN